MGTALEVAGTMKECSVGVKIYEIAEMSPLVFAICDWYTTQVTLEVARVSTLLQRRRRMFLRP